jgi:hypothetical protein
MCAQQGGGYLVICARGGLCYRAAPCSLSSRYTYKALHIHSSLTNCRKFPELEVPTVVRKKKERLKGHFHAKVPVRKGKTAIPTSRQQPTGLHRSFRAVGPTWDMLKMGGYRHEGG